MARQVNYDAKIKAIEAKIEKKTNEVKNLKEKIKDLKVKQNKAGIESVKELFIKFENIDAESIVEIVTMTQKANIPLADIVKMVKDEISTRPAQN
ncbi:hypothetical protein ACTNDZ_13990 [Selenomonas montiformis]|uniref:hypothetical protein n=1 Tax=Selenomonas montiformis TaxID=2652285 RepID=UPI003F8B42F5